MSFQELVVNTVSSNIGLIVGFLVSCWFVFVYLPKKPKNFPPGPTGIPILGVALSIGERPEKTFRKWGEKYGDIIGFKVGNSYTVVLNSYELIQEAFVKYATTFSHRPDNFLFIEGLRKNGISGSDYSTNYMTHRNFAHGILGKLGFGKTVMEVPILDEARHLIETLGEGNIEFNEDVKTKIGFASGNIIAQVAFGKRYADNKNPEFKIIMQAWMDFFHTGAPAFNAALISPLLLYLPFLKQSAMAVKTGMDKMIAVAEKIIKEHEATVDMSDPRDFIDEYLIEKKQNGTDELYTDKMMAAIVRDLFGGGLETTQLTLIYGMLILANRPHISKKIHDEIDTVLGPEGKPRYALREKMPRCLSFIKEMLRCRPAGPLLVPHAVKENVKFKGYEIPKGSTILGNAYAVHHSPKHWKNPDEFNPDRFIDENGKVDVPKYLMPFGMGPRTCIGRRLADMELFIFFVTLLQHYNVIPTPKPGCERPWVPEEPIRTGITVVPPHDTPVTLIPREGVKSRSPSVAE